MVDLVEPKPTEVVGDPACGTAGFLVGVMSISRYRETEYEEAKYDPPQDILRRLRSLDDEVSRDMDDLETMLR